MLGNDMNCCRYMRIFLTLVLLVSAGVFPSSVFADEIDDESVSRRDTVYYLGNVVNTGLDNGFSEASPIEVKDPHFGWELGRFYVSGFTSKAGDDTPIFLKNSGDQVALFFTLDQSIDALNGDDSLIVSRDKNGYDEYFFVPKTDFGRGTLIVRHTDYRNSSEAPQVYTDYLSGVEIGANTQIDLFEEGDYEVALDYEIESPGLFNNPIKHSYDNYRIYFKFKVRNSNAMAFLFDDSTGNELYNGSVTSNGFRIDLAGSHYLNVSIKRETLNDNGNALIEDTRFNKSAADGDVFTEEGVYTVTISNPSTGEDSTVKKVYVGTDEVLKASVANSLSVNDTRAYIDDGVQVAEDGTLMLASLSASSPEHDTAVEGHQANGSNSQDVKKLNHALPIVAISIVAALAATGIIFSKRNRLRIGGKASDFLDSTDLETENPKDDAQRGE